MLPKPEKNKKNTSVEQLDLVDSLSLEKKVKNKRRFILICLIATTGLSFAFWTYRSGSQIITTKSFSKIEFKLPQIKMSDIKLSYDNFNITINQLISKDKNQWSIYAKTISKDSDYSLNATDLINDSENKVNSLSKLPDSSSTSLIKDSLPQGTKIQESDTNYLITTPQQKIIIQFKIDGQNIEESKKTIPSLVEKIYWYLTLK
jgi:hypothetical protein